MTVNETHNRVTKTLLVTKLPASKVLAKLILFLIKTGLPNASWRVGTKLPNGWDGSLEAVQHGWLTKREGTLVFTARGEFACRVQFLHGQRKEITRTTPNQRAELPLTNRELARLNRAGGERLALTICAQVFNWSYAQSATLSRFGKACYQQVRRRYLGKIIVDMALARGWVAHILQGTRNLYVLTKLGYSKLKEISPTSNSQSPNLLGDLLASL